MVEVGRQLRDQDGAEAVVMGLRREWRAIVRPLEEELGIPVIDPMQAAGQHGVGGSPVVQPRLIPSQGEPFRFTPRARVRCPAVGSTSAAAERPRSGWLGDAAVT